MNENDTPVETQQQQAHRLATEKFILVGSSASADSLIVQTEAGTGSKYVVVVTKLPEYHGQGGSHLISLLQPWQKNMAYELMDGEEIHPSYLAEKLLRDGKSVNEVHGGDFAAMCLTVNWATSRHADRTAEFRLTGNV